jgi:hypothetical protein
MIVTNFVKWVEPHSCGGSAMSRPSTVRKPTPTELRRIHRRLEKPLLPWQRRRAEVLLLHAADQPAARIAQLLQVHPNTVYADLHAFAQRPSGRPRACPASRSRPYGGWPRNRLPPWACRTAAGPWPSCGRI